MANKKNRYDTPELEAKANIYKKARAFKLPHHFPRDQKYLKAQKELFAYQGNGWWVKSGMRCGKMPVHWYKPWCGWRFCKTCKKNNRVDSFHQLN